MPATSYDFTARSYEVRCLGCGTSVHTDEPYNRNALTTDGAPVLETFPWYSRGAFSTRCRVCTRANRRRANARQRAATATSRALRGLGVGRRYGVEFEASYPRGVGRYEISSALSAAGLSGWRVKTDISIRGNGWEVVTPPLSGEEGIEEIKRGLRVLRGLGATVDQSTGTHVHHEIRDLDLAAVKRFARTFANAQNLISGLVAPSRRNAYYSRTFSPEMAREVEAISELSRIGSYGTKYRSLNFLPYGRYGTVEIRQHQGTLSGEKIATWIRFGQALIDTAAEGETVAPQTRVRDLLAALGSRLDETARTFLLGRAVEFGAVAV